jgi:hypothetical protein
MTNLERSKRLHDERVRKVARQGTYKMMKLRKLTKAHNNTESSQDDIGQGHIIRHYHKWIRCRIRCGQGQDKMSKDKMCEDKMSKIRCPR